MAKFKSKASAYGTLSGLAREGPASIWDLNGNWRPEAVDTLTSIADKLLGVEPGGASGKTFRGETPEQQVLTEDFSDFAVWDADVLTCYARRRRPGARRFHVATTDARYRKKRGLTA